MFGLKIPAIAAAGAATLFAFGGVSALPGGQALADEGGGGSGSASATASAGASAESMAVSPTSVAPGGVVTLHLQSSCASGHKAKASADVFVDAVTLAPSGDGSQGLEGSAFIKSDAVDGSYAISVDCDGVTSSAEASITVTTSSAELPIAPVPAGGGGTAQLAAGPGTAGTSTNALLVTGGFAAAGLAGLVVHRRRSSGRG